MRKEKGDRWMLEGTQVNNSGCNIRCDRLEEML
jgi:hypothetical protein